MSHQKKRPYNVQKGTRMALCIAYVHQKAAIFVFQYRLLKHHLYPTGVTKITDYVLYSI